MTASRNTLIPEEIQEKWQELCEKIMQERDPKKLTALAEELNRVLEEREKAKASRAS